MSKQFYRANRLNLFLFKCLYYIAKAFGMVFFTITKRHKFRYSRKSHILSVLHRVVLLACLVYLTPDTLQKLWTNVPQWHLRAVLLVHHSIAFIFAFVYTFYQIKFRQFVKFLNRSKSLLIRLTEFTGNFKIFGCDFYVVAFFRCVSNWFTISGETNKLGYALSSGDNILIVQFLLNYSLNAGVFIMIDFVCFGYLVSSSMFRHIGNHMAAIAKRIENFENPSMSQVTRVQMLRNYSKEIDECSKIYSQIFKMTREFHGLFQLSILHKLFVDIFLTVGYVHYLFLTYFKTGFVTWKLVGLGVVRCLDLVCLMLVIDMAIRRSKMPHFLNWDSLASDIDKMWDKSVDCFLNQLRFEELKIFVCGLFQINNELCLRVFSVVVAYLTIMIQFGMMGCFEIKVAQKEVSFFAAVE